MKVPAQYKGQRLWVRWDAAMVRVFDNKMQKLISHVRLEKGQYSSVLGAGGCRCGLVESINNLRSKVVPMGEDLTTWADNMIATDQDQALRRLQGLLRFKGKFTSKRMNEAARNQRLDPRPIHAA